MLVAGSGICGMFSDSCPMTWFTKFLSHVRCSYVSVFWARLIFSVSMWCRFVVVEESVSYSTPHAVVPRYVAAEGKFTCARLSVLVSSRKAAMLCVREIDALHVEQAQNWPVGM